MDVDREATVVESNRTERGIRIFIYRAMHAT
jgi:hypothetical protein